MQRKITDPLGQLKDQKFRENAKDTTGHEIEDTHNRDAGDDRKEKTMVEKDRPHVYPHPKGPGAQHVNRQMHYRNLKDENARENEKSQGLRTDQDKEQTPKFVVKEESQLRSIFEKAEAKDKDKSDTGREDPDHEHTR